MIAEEEEERRRKGDEGPFPQDSEFKNNPPHDEFRSYKEFPIYEALCRGEETHVWGLILFCHYLLDPAKLFLNDVYRPFHFSAPTRHGMGSIPIPLNSIWFQIYQFQIYKF